MTDSYRGMKREQALIGELLWNRDPPDVLPNECFCVAFVKEAPQHTGYNFAHSQHFAICFTHPRVMRQDRLPYFFPRQPCVSSSLFSSANPRRVSFSYDMSFGGRRRDPFTLCPQSAE